MKNSILGKARWLLVAALATVLTTNAWGTDYELINSTDDLVADAHYVIGSAASGSACFMSTTENTNNRPATSAITITNGKITATAAVLDLQLKGSAGAWKFLTTNYAGTDGYLSNAASGTNNRCLVGNTQREFTIAFSGDAAVITATSGSARNLLRFNSTLFACYGSGQDPVYLFKEVSSGCTAPTISAHPASATYTVGDSPTALSVTASGTSLTYQWYSNTTATNTGGTSIIGQTSSTYTPSTASNGTFYYYCVVSSGSCSTNSNVATITVNKASATIKLSEAGAESSVSGTHYSGDSYTLPSSTEASCGSKVLVGWSTVTVAETNTKPSSNYYDKGSSVTLAAGENKFYAVFAEVSGELSNSYAPITSGLETANYVIAYSYNGGTQIVLQNTADNSSPSDKLEGYNLSLSDSKYSNPAASYIWELRAQSDGSYYIYNTAVEKYVNATTTPALTLSTTPTKFTITYDGTNSRWTIQIKESTSYYIHGYVNGSTYDFRCSTSGSGARYKIYLYKQESNITYAKYSTTCSTDPELSVTPTALDFGNVANGTYKEMTFSLSGTHLTANASIAVSGTNSGYFTVTPNSVDKGSGTISATNITVRYTPGAVGDGHTATVTVTSGEAEAKTVTLTGNSKATYSVSISPTPTNGTVTADKTSGIMAGETVTLTITPSSGYQLSSITANSGAVSLSGTGNTRTFTMPAGNVTIAATFTVRTDYVLVTNVSELGEGDLITIANMKGNNVEGKILHSQAENNRNTKEVTTAADGKIADSDVEYPLVLVSDASGWKLYDQTNSGYLYAVKGSNYLKNSATPTPTYNDVWTIEIVQTAGDYQYQARIHQTPCNGGGCGQESSKDRYIEFNGSTLSAYLYTMTDGYIYKKELSCEKLAAPTDLTASSITKTTCTLSWNSVTNASGYEISLDNGSSWTSTSTSTSYNATGLTAGTTYNWKVRATGDGDTYCAKGNAASSTVTMKNAVTVTYNDNGKTSGSVPATANLIEGDSYTVAGNTGTLVKDGYTWAGWHNSTTYNATPAYGTGGSTITVNSSIILYANWAPKRDTFIDGVHGNATQYGDGSYTVPSCSNATRHTTGTCEETHYKFIGWALSGADLTNQANIISAGGSKNATNATYYAVWAEEL